MNTSRFAVRNKIGATISGVTLAITLVACFGCRKPASTEKALLPASADEALPSASQLRQFADQARKGTLPEALAKLEEEFDRFSKQVAKEVTKAAKEGKDSCKVSVGLASTATRSRLVTELRKQGCRANLVPGTDYVIAFSQVEEFNTTWLTISWDENSKSEKK